MWPSLIVILHAVSTLVVRTEDPLIEDTLKLLGSSTRQRLEQMLAKAETGKCRSEIVERFTDWMQAEIEEHGNWMGSSSKQVSFEFKSECKEADNAEMWSKKPSRTLEEMKYAAEHMHIAYFLMAHSMPPQLATLIETLQHPNHYFIVHVDGKLGDVERKPFEALQASNVLVMRRSSSVNVTWGGRGMIDAMIRGMRATMALIQQGRRFDWWIDLSESTVPTMNESSIRAKLATHPPGANLMVTRKKSVDDTSVWYQFHECDNKMHRVGKLTLPKGIGITGGSQWFMVNLDFVQYVVSDNELPKKLYAYMARTEIPDESFFQTLIMASPFCHTVVNYDAVFVAWDKHESPGSHKCLWAKKDACGRSPVTLLEEDLPVVQNSEWMFARKLDFAVPGSKKLFDAITYLSQHTNEPTPPLNGVMFKGDEGCLSSKGKGQKSTWIARCDSDDPRQRFNIGPCWGDDLRPIIFGKDGCVARDDEASSETHQQWVSSVPESRPIGKRNKLCKIKNVDNLCIDFAGMVPAPNRELIGWECNKGWNQLFIFRSGTCSIAIEPPKDRSMMHGRVRLCASTNRTTGRLESAYCTNNDRSQRFSMQSDAMPWLTEL